MDEDRNFWTSTMTRRISRRSALRGLGLGGAGLAAAAMIGCGDDDDDDDDAAPAAAKATAAPTKAAAAATAAPTKAAAAASTPEVSAGDPKIGGMISQPHPGDPAGYDRHLTHSDTPLWSLILGSLTNRDPDTGSQVPSVLESWEFPEPTKLIMQNVPGIKWNDRPPTNGRVLTSDDVAFAIERSRGPAGQYRSQFAGVTDVEIADTKTVAVQYDAPSRDGVRRVLRLQVVAPEQHTMDEKYPIDEVNRLVGVGAFMIDDINPGIGGRVVRNPDHFRGASRLDAFEWTFIADKASLLAAYRTGGFDMGTSLTAVNTDQRKQLEGTNPDITYETNPQGFPYLFIYNLERKPFDDLRVRRAMNLVVNRQQMIALNAAGAGYLSGPYSSVFLPDYAISESELLTRPGFRPEKDQDIKEAKKLMDAAGLAEGFKIEAEGTDFYAILNRDPAILVVDDFRKIDIDLEITRTLDRAGFLDVATAGDFNFRAAGIGSGSEIGTITVYLGTDAPRNYGRYSNSRVDELLAAENQEMDDEAVKPIGRELQEIVLKELPVIFNYWAFSSVPIQPWTHPVKANHLSGMGWVHEWWTEKA